MLYAKRTVRCSARNLDREAARESLERQFEDAEVIKLTRQGNKWVAVLLEPKTAEFPPKDDEDSEDSGPPFGSSDDDSSDSDSDSSDSDSSDGPPSPSDSGDGPPKKEKGGGGPEMAVVMDVLMAIADKLGVVPGMGAPGAEDPTGMPPPAGPPGPPHAGPPGGGPPGAQKMQHERALKPGETPPGGTPIGAPAFASVNGVDLSRLASFDAYDDTPNKSIRQAHYELTNLYGPYGFQVRQIKRVEGGTRLAAKLSRR